ncbi:MAG: hypothetical protein ACSW8C_03480, partial [bacterium]
GGIVMGTLQIFGGVISAFGAGKSQKQTSKLKGTQTSEVKSLDANATNPDISTNAKVDIEKSIELKDIEYNKDKWQAIGSTFGSAGGLANSIAAIVNAHHQAEAKDADIGSTIQDAIMEVLRKMQDEGSNEFKQLLQFISTLLQMLHELQQNASSTEKTIVQA